MSSGILIGLLIAGLAIASLWIFVISREYRREKASRERLEQEILSAKNAPISQLFDILVRPALEAISRPIQTAPETNDGVLQEHIAPCQPQPNAPEEACQQIQRSIDIMNFKTDLSDLGYIAKTLGLDARQFLALKAKMRLRPGHEQVIHALLEDRPAFNKVVSMYLVSGATGDLIASWIIDAVDIALGRQGKEGSE